MDLNQLKADVESRMKKAIDVLFEKLRGLRSGVASTALVDGIKADYYGVPTPLRQMASVSIPEPRQLLIRPFDQGALSGIEKAIIAANIGLTPANDGKVIRLNIPPLSEERRRSLADQVKKLGEETRVALRNIRRDAVKDLESIGKEKKLKEDLLFREKDNLQKSVDTHEKKIEQLLEAKIKEIKG